MRVLAFLISEFATVGQDGRISIAGVIEQVNAVQPQAAPGEASPTFLMRPFYVVAIMDGSLSDGLEHVYHLRVLGGDGESLVDTPIPLAFQLNAQGRPMRANIVIQFAGLMLPGFDNYTIELRVDDATAPIAWLALPVDPLAS